MQHQAKQDVYRNSKFRKHTSFPSGKQRQKKFGRGRPTAIFIASVMTAVTKTEYKRPAWYASLHQLCNSPSPLLVDILFFELSLSGFPSKFLKRVCYREISTPLSRMLCSPLRPMWDLTIHPLQSSASLLALVSLSNRCGQRK